MSSHARITYEADDAERDEAADDARVLEVDVVEGGGAVPHPRVAHADRVGEVVLFVLWDGGVCGVGDSEHGIIVILCRDADAAAVADDGDAGRAVVKMPASKVRKNYRAIRQDVAQEMERK